jgi:hypothetical protein
MSGLGSDIFDLFMQREKLKEETDRRKNLKETTRSHLQHTINRQNNV